MIPISIGSSINTASSINITHNYHEIPDNTNVINTINPTSPNFSGILFLKATHNPPAHLGSGGNINIPFETALIGGNRVNMLFYNNNNNLWELLGGQ